MTAFEFPPPRSADSRPMDVIEHTAADWLVRRQAGFTPADAAELEAWLAADPRHAVAFAKVEAAWVTLSRPRADGNVAGVLGLLATSARRRTRRRRQFLGVVAMGAAAALALMLPSSRESVPAEPSPDTVALRPDLHTLPDGSTLELKAKAEYAMAFTEAERTVILQRGEAIFAVARDTSRPFVVLAGKVRIRALGTVFMVRHDPHQVDVLVTEGAVRVAPAANQAPEPLSSAPSKEDPDLILTAGKRVRLPLAADVRAAISEEAARVTPLSFDEVGRELSWRSQRVEFTGTPLPEAIDWFNRYNRLQIVIAEPALRSRQITGIHWVNDPDGFVRLLENALEIRTERSGETITLY